MATLICRIMGPVFILVAIWGFITGDRVLIFHVNPAHNWVHLISGALALWAGFSNERFARNFCLAFGAVYGLVAILGFARFEPLVTALHLNMADNWLHLVLSMVFLVGAFVHKPITFGTHGPRGRIPPHPTPMG